MARCWRLVGRGEPQDATTADGTLASNLRISVLRGMAQDAVRKSLSGRCRSRPCLSRRPGRESLYLRRRRNQIRIRRATADQRPRRNSARREAWYSIRRATWTSPKLSATVSARSPRRESSQPSTRCPIRTGTGPRQVEGLSIDAQDNLYLTEWLGHTVLRISANGSVTTIAGTGAAGFSGDGGPATAAQLYGPSAVAIAVRWRRLHRRLGQQPYPESCPGWDHLHHCRHRPQHRKHSSATLLSDVRIFRRWRTRDRRAALQSSTTRLRQSRRLIRRRFWQRPREKDLA